MIRLHALGQVFDSIIKRPAKKSTSVFKDESPLSDILLHQLVALSAHLERYTGPKQADGQEKLFYALASAFSVAMHVAKQYRDGRISYPHLQSIIKQQFGKHGVEWNCLLAHQLKHHLPFCAWLSV